MSYLFNDLSSIGKDYFRNTIKLRLSDIHNQNWSDSVSNNSTCINYSLMTEQKKLQDYLLKLPDQYMYALCKLKCVNHKMPIVTGRYANIPAEDRICNLCQLNEKGDEYHYLLKCPFLWTAEPST